MLNAARAPLTAVAIVALAAITAVLILVTPPSGHDRAAPDPVPSTTPVDSAAASQVQPTSEVAGPSAAPVFLRYEVGLPPGGYTIFEVDPAGAVTAERSIGFERPSMAPVDRIEAANGLIHWRTVVGPNAGWSYVPGTSGEFLIREVVRWPDGHTQNRPVDPQG
jgi:hypothetical protein